jgi:hypothetical protein
MLYYYPFPSRLKWVSHPFKRGYEFVDEGGQYMGKMQFSTFGKTIQSELNGIAIKFVLEGVFLRKVQIFDEKDQHLGYIQLSLFGKSIIYLDNGEVYFWKRKNIFMQHWQVIHDLPNTDNDPISIEYQYLSQFVKESGDIQVLEESNQSETLTLIGFFLGMYFIRQRKRNR